MMRSIQQRIRARVLEAQDQSAERLPPWLRRMVRAGSGGDEWTAQFVRGMVWKYRWLITVAVLANLGAGFAEAGTLGVFTLALNQMTAMVANTPVDTSGTLSALVQRIADFFGTQQPILILLILAVVFQLARSGLDYAGQAATIYLRVWLEGDLQRRVFGQLTSIRYQQIADSRLGNLASYSTQVQEIGAMVQALNQLLNDLIIILAYVAVLFWLSWQFTLIAVIGLVLLSVALRGVRESIRRSVARFLDLSVRLNERLLEYLQGMRVVHIFVREERVVNEVNTLINAGIQARRTGLLRSALILPLFQSLTIVAVALFLGIGFWVVTQSGMILAGELATYAFVIYRIMPRIANFNSQLGVIARQWPYVWRIAELLDPADKELEYRPGKRIEQIAEGIDFREVALRYPGNERDAISHLTFRIPAGKMVALVGTSGSGKSSIINLLLGIYRPTAGQILIDGVDLQSCDLASWRRLIGVVDQEPLIFSSSIAENIRFGKTDASDEEVIAAARTAHADLFIQELPQGYATEVGDRGHRLSGGQRQRIAIARAIIHDPALLLFDEATSALDSQSERLIQESLEELRKTRTVVAIAHRLSTIAKADRIIVLDQGQIVEQGSHPALLAQGGRYAAMWQLQASAA
ncbi:MAG: ABC transporter ATP-binding protein [Caldilineaceae bacterium]|nr:ABC transporter ATP-binding protein [Caldilineaceae bacterium]